MHDICFIFIVSIISPDLRSLWFNYLVRQIFAIEARDLLDSIKVFLLKISRNINATGRCVGKGMCHTTAVSYNKKTFVTGFQILIDLNFHVVEFNFNTIKQSIIICSSWRDLIQCIDHLDDTIQDTFWHNKA